MPPVDLNPENVAYLIGTLLLGGGVTGGGMAGLKRLRNGHGGLDPVVEGLKEVAKAVRGEGSDSRALIREEGKQSRATMHATTGTIQAVVEKVSKDTAVLLDREPRR